MKIIQIPCDQVDFQEGKDLSELQVIYSRDIHIGKALPEGVEVLSVEELLHQLNESDPEYYFKIVLDRNQVLK